MTEKSNSGLSEQSAVPDKDPNMPKSQGKIENPDKNRNAPRDEPIGTSDQQRAEQEERRTRQETSEKDIASDEDLATDQKPEHPVDKGEQHRAFPVVGVGASAGGLEAFEQFVSHLPEDSGIAFVMITHTHPDHPTRMPELLRRKTAVPVVLLEDGMTLEPDTLYITPSDRDPVIKNRVIRLRERRERTEMHMPIDLFLKSLAEDLGEAAGCVILSGTATDGTNGLRSIKENAGVAIAQRKESARYEGMPASAIETGMVDYILDPAEIPEQLIAYFRHSATLQSESRETKEPPDTLPKILSYLFNKTDHDFSQYKKNTLIRRIERRMSVSRCQTMNDYYKFLHRNPGETGALFQDLLIGVTNFFRDPEVFAYVKENVLPDLLAEVEKNDSFRVWVPGCSSGEEVYSVAIIIQEAMETLALHRQVQIFATDIDKTAIEKARQGVYPKNIITEVSAERLSRFFTEEGNYYRVNRALREPIVFAEQNVLRDPPFMHLDLLVCRNLLIYLEPAAQNKILPLFHFNLKTGGILFLGTSESPGKFTELFHPVNKKFSIYKKRDIKSPLQQVHFPTGGKKVPHPGPRPEKKHEAQTHQPFDIIRIIEKTLLQQHTPPCVVVDHSGDVIYFHGRTGQYLEHSPGKPNLRITEMAREGLRYALSSAFHRAVENKREIRETGVRVRTNGGYEHIDLTIAPLDLQHQDKFLILFHKIPEPTIHEEKSAAETKEATEGTKDTAARRITELERKLDTLREDYRSTQEELETANEELKSSNEEMYSSNEELQSTNEELESSREELESLNEELSTVNSELHENFREIQNAYSTITEVLNSTGVAIVFLDNELRIKRFTEEATQMINLIDKDMGRPFSHISHNLEFTKLADAVRQVLKRLAPVEEDVRTTDGQWYRMRIMVHRTGKNVIEGVVLTFVNIDVQKNAQKELKAQSEKAVSSAKAFAEQIIDTVRESLLVLDDAQRVITANRRFYEMFQTTAGRTEGVSLFELSGGQWDIPELHRLLDEITAKKTVFENYRVEHHFKDIGFKRMLLNARQLRDGETGEGRILLAIEDVTGS